MATGRANRLLGLVLFFCTFLSLRSHDDGHRYSHIRDFELKGEAEYFGGFVLTISVPVCDISLTATQPARSVTTATSTPSASTATAGPKRFACRRAFAGATWRSTLPCLTSLPAFLPSSLPPQLNAPPVTSRSIPGTNIARSCVRTACLSGRPSSPTASTPRLGYVARTT